MDSSSNHNVFLSYKSQDTNKTFTNHLYVALTHAGIITFKHDHHLPVGHNLQSLSHKAIRQSRLSVVVFSKNYACSESCLDELVNIVECKVQLGQLVVPVFYDVDSDYLCKDLGEFGGGNHLSMYEAKFIQQIVRHVVEKLQITKLHVARHPVGLEFRVKKIYSLLKIGSNDVRIVGIYGMGGIGKSTIAKSFYNSSFHRFEGSCFLANVREVSKQPNGLVRLQKQLLSQIVKGAKVKIANDHIGKTFLQERLCYKRALIVLDDVDQLSQLEALAGQRHWFGLGSRIIITTRNEHLLTQAKVDEKYRTVKLNHSESLRLFSWHAFKRPVPLVNYKKLSNKIVNYIGGIPLALEVLGASLLGQTKKELWQSTLDKLRQIPPHKILEKLRISYETLDDVKIKNIFLDIACFLIGMDKDYVFDILDGCGLFPGVGISILVDRCLLGVGSNNKLKMHDLVRDLGRKVVNEKSPYEPGNHSRIWLQKDGSEAIEGLVLDLLAPMHLETKAFERMHKLRLLQINNVHLHGNFEGLFKELRWLCWHHCPLNSLPDELHPGKLVFLDMQHSKFNTLWQGTKFLGNLKILNIGESESLTTTPDFTGVPNLEKLSLMSCPRLLNVNRTIGHLTKLTSLNLGYCNNLNNLPSNICNLRSLQTLSLRFALKLEQLPDKLGDMEQLRNIDLSATAIEELPDSIGSLGNLSSLFLEECKNLRGLPSSLCNVISLEYLYMRGCSSVHNLPEDVGKIKHLKWLSLIGTGVERLPESIGLLGELTLLSLDKCKNLQSLPRSVCNLTSLKIFNIGFCPKIELGESVQMWDKRLPNLTRFNIKNCDLSEQDIPHNLGAFSLLEDLILGGNSFCSLPLNLGQLSNVFTLDLGGCRNLKSVEVFPPNLNWLILEGCSSLERLSVSKLKSLSSLNLKNCSSLAEILGLENLYLIKSLQIEGCSSLSIAFTTSLIQGDSGLVHDCAIYFSRMEIPNWFEYQTIGSSLISFDVPADFHLDQLHVTLWADYSFGKLSNLLRRFNMHIRNLTNDDELTLSLWGTSFEEGSWVRHISPDYPIKSGDKIEVYLEVKDKH
ncbi:TMV resistance protein N-like protein [Tanacetum coccineum]